MCNLFIYANYGWNYLGTYSDYDKAQEAREKIKENSVRMVAVEQANMIGSEKHMMEEYTNITGKALKCTKI